MLEEMSCSVWCILIAHVSFRVFTENGSIDMKGAG